MASILSSVILSTSKRMLACSAQLRQSRVCIVSKTQIATSGCSIATDVSSIPGGCRLYSERPTIASSTSSPLSSTASSSPQTMSQMIPLQTHRKFRSSNFTQQSQRAEEMKDEYGEMTDDGETFTKNDFILENGVVLPKAELRYQTYGVLNEAKDNVIVVCHALTGNASLHSWWGGLLGDNKAFDTSKYFIVCCNILGSCYGSTNPQSTNPETNAPYGKDFPDVSVKDTVKLQLHLVKEKLGASSIKCVIGGSFGGMQTMEFAVQGGIPGGEFVAANGSPFVRSVIPIACGASHTAWQIAISEVQRQAIYADPEWKNDPFNATKGLEVARQMGMISYRTAYGYRSKFGRDIRNDDDNKSTNYGSNALWQVKSYLEYQGIKFIDRFDPITYVKMTEQMDSHDVSRGRGPSVAEVLQRVEIPACVLGIDSDVLYPLSEQEEIVQHMPNSKLVIIRSDEGHDGFLLEQEQVNRCIVDFLAKLST
mmetsp:Transcript_11448/g.32945  ORF Transcript_11448/g.32945 Transcript_11448/m.32945 type:complete len:481 (+) Transcript_11448:221-1663(+)|eukprot:CAMPEP_0172367048 /NCGR_PEP_ID=MMETSP1060-20121228/18539_1 /TAXON_ID=37318 /ORGANISM="Pseudo-nitzschia pungens, Strain cf. cingulata" /LENGTH=480 /DNA_ID=CAMNT_0013091115 /DNA_START=149 /DNA_END=1591 /DNA_ORIENTATION=+